MYTALLHKVRTEEMHTLRVYTARLSGANRDVCMSLMSCYVCLQSQIGQLRFLWPNNTLPANFTSELFLRVELSMIIVCFATVCYCMLCYCMLCYCMPVAIRV